MDIHGEGNGRFGRHGDTSSDAVLYSITNNEWNIAKEKLEKLLIYYGNNAQ